MEHKDWKNMSQQVRNMENKIIATKYKLREYQKEKEWNRGEAAFKEIRVKDFSRTEGWPEFPDWMYTPRAEREKNGYLW